MIGLIFIVVALTLLVDAIIKAKTEQAPVVPTCPPHSWRHVELKDGEGNVIAWKLVCSRCGPLNVEE